MAEQCVRVCAGGFKGGAVQVSGGVPKPWASTVALPLSLCFSGNGHRFGRVEQIATVGPHPARYRSRPRAHVSLCA